MIAPSKTKSKGFETFPWDGEEVSTMSKKKRGGRVSLLLDGLFGLTLSAEPKRDVDLVLFIVVATL